MGKSRKIITIILAAMLALFMNGAPAAKVYAATKYDVWVNGEQFTSDKTTIDCGSGTAKFDATKNTLTLNNATISDTMCPKDQEYSGSFFGNAQIYSRLENLNIVLIGTNKIGRDSSNGIVAAENCSITINGQKGASLDFKGNNCAILAGMYSSKSTVTISGGVTVTATMLKSSGIVADCGITIKDSIFKLSQNPDIEYNYYSGLEIENGSIEINNSKVDITTGYNGINAPAAMVNITDSEVTITAKNNAVSLQDSSTDEKGVVVEGSKVTLEVTGDGKEEDGQDGWGIFIQNHYSPSTDPENPKEVPDKVNKNGIIVLGESTIKIFAPNGGTNLNHSKITLGSGATYKSGSSLNDAGNIILNVPGSVSKKKTVTVNFGGKLKNITFQVDADTNVTRNMILGEIKKQGVNTALDNFVFMGVAPKKQSEYSGFSDYNKDVNADKVNGWSVKVTGDISIYGIWFNKISEVSVTVTPPTCGDKAATPAVTTSTKGCNVSGTWTKSSKVSDTSAFTGTFEGGSTYHLNVKLDNKWGYAFAPDGKVTVKVNGGTLKEKSLKQNGADSDLSITADVVAVHETTKVTAKDATEKADGNIEHYACKHCDKLFTDAAGKKLTTKKDVTIPAKGGSSKKDNQKGEDGTNLGKGASEKLAEKTILSTKSESDPKGSVFNVLQLKAKKIKKNQITLSCANAKKKGAVKYILYGNKCGKKNKYLKLASSKKNTFNIKKIAKTKLEKGTYYKFIAIAVDKNGKVVSTSKTVHVSTTGGKVGNYKKVTTAAKKNKVTVKVKKKFKLKAKAVAASKKQKVNKHRAIKYESTNTKIATVNAKGVITGKKKGTCYVYAYSQSGVAAKIKVTVKK